MAKGSIREVETFDELLQAAPVLAARLDRLGEIGIDVEGTIHVRDLLKLLDELASDPAVILASKYHGDHRGRSSDNHDRVEGGPGESVKHPYVAGDAV